MTAERIDFSHVTREAATWNDYPVIQNMGRFYVYDMSEYMGSEEGWQMPEDGLYQCIDFKKYWQTDGAFPFLIRYKGELAGFVIVDKKGSDDTIDFNIAQFYILRKFKGKGLGAFVARECFDVFRGVWEVMVMPQNTGAYQFWNKTITAYTNNTATQYTRNVAHLNNSPKNIFRFKS
ncbi:MAG: GNAT family N-acetyltransferase [Chlamydiales bacterium]|nr:GNAT family N-acetyltransferase [Chlamydiales bacterium]